MYEKDKKIDQILKSKLTKVKPDIKHGSWEQLAERLDAIDADEAFDQAVSHRLSSMNIPYEDSSWTALAARLELERSRMHEIVTLKLTELSLLLLLFVFVGQCFPEKNLDSVPDIQGMPIAAAIAEKPSIETAKIVTAPANSVSKGNKKEVVGLNNKPYTYKEESDKSVLTEQVRDYSVTSTLPSSYRVVDTPLPTERAQQQLKKAMAEKTADWTIPSDDLVSNESIAALTSESIVLLYSDETADLSDFLRPVERQTFFRIGFVGSPDYNRIVTPPQEIENGDIVSYDRYSLGYSGGVTLGIEHGKWEIETGATYAARRYQTIPTVYVSGTIKDGYRGLGLRDFELNTVNLPLNFRYNFLLHDKWRVYAQGGASLNLILGANYYTVDQTETAGILRNGETGAIFDKPQALQDKSLTAGWFEGGALLQNSTLFGDIGIGMERYMTPNWSMFVQPTYRHSFLLFNEGVGPYLDQIHSFGIGMGVKVRL